jgi:DNA-binding NtrC family response regulator
MSDYNIWLIDDDPIQNKFNKRTISKVITNHCNIETYTNARDALLVLKKRSSGPDLTFIDLDMPSMKGVDYIKEIKKLGSQSPVVILSSSINDEILQFVKGCHLVHACIHKPLKRADLDFCKSLSSFSS